MKSLFVLGSMLLIAIAASAQKHKKVFIRNNGCYCVGKSDTILIAVPPKLSDVSCTPGDDDAKSIALLHEGKPVTLGSGLSTVQAWEFVVYTGNTFTVRGAVAGLNGKKKKPRKVFQVSVVIP